MKCITVKQPWATLLAGGATRYLVRGWRTFHRGPLVIAASNRFPRTHVELCCDPDMRAILRRYGYDYAMELPTQRAVGTVNLADCLLVTRDTLSLFDPNDPAVVFGWIQVGCWVWLCTDPRMFAQPVPLSGRLGIYSIPTALIPVR
jgi:hypothetical protein